MRLSTGCFLLVYFVCFVGKPKTMSELIYKDESYRIIGACFEVSKEKGCGFLETPHRAAIRVRGADRVEFLQKMLTNDVKLEPGRGPVELIVIDSVEQPTPN